MLSTPTGGEGRESEEDEAKWTEREEEEREEEEEGKAFSAEKEERKEEEGEEEEEEPEAEEKEPWKISYQNIGRSIDSTNILLEKGRQEKRDLVFVAEAWEGKKGERTT